MGKIPRDSWAIIERIIRRYPKNKREYEATYRDMVNVKTGNLLQTTVPASGSILGNPTEKSVIVMLDTPKMQRLRREIQAVETVYNKLPEEHQKVIQIRFWLKQGRSTPYFLMESSVSYKEAQLKRISGNFVKDVGKELGEL